jgi:hypothetical protein
MTERYWISWFAHPTVSYELHTPWWVSGARLLNDDEMTEQGTLCAAVRAASEDAAKAVIVAAHDEPVDLEWRFVEPRPADWSPFSDRFPRAKWMKWSTP